jgi:DHA1 family bicyclomycin/chloramphenicol resistance-like MFS transporter
MDRCVSGRRTLGGAVAQESGPPGEAMATPVSTASWQAFALVATALMIGQGSLSLVAAPLPLYLARLGVGTTRIGTEVSASNLVAVACTLLVGPVINRLGPHRLMRTGMGFYLVAALGLLLLPSELAVVACRALQGCGSALVMPSALTMAPRIVPLRAGTALGAIGSLNNLAMAICPPVGLWLYERGGAGGLFLPAAICAAFGLAFGFLIPKLPRTATPVRGFGYDRNWTAVLVGNTLFLAYFGGIAAYLALSLAHPGAPNAGLFFTADAIGVALLRTPSGVLVDRYGPRPAQALGVAITLVGLGALAVTTSTLTLILAGVATGVGAGFFIAGVLVTLAKRSGDHNRGTAMAMSAASLNVGLLAGSALSGPLYAAHGFGAVLLLGTVTTLAVLPLILVDREPAPQVQAVG